MASRKGWRHGWRQYDLLVLWIWKSCFVLINATNAIIYAIIAYIKSLQVGTVFFNLLFKGTHIVFRLFGVPCLQEKKYNSLILINDQIHEISFEIRMETILPLMTFAVFLCYNNIKALAKERPDLESNPVWPLQCSTSWAVRPTGS